MIDLSFLEELLDQLPDLLMRRSSILIILQLAIMLIVFLLAEPIWRFLLRPLNKIQAGIVQTPAVKEAPWMGKILPVLQGGLRPLTIWLLSQAAIGIFDNLGLDYQVIEWALPLLMLWFWYKIARQGIDLYFSSEQADRWGERILRPLVTAIAILYAIGFLQRILNLSFRVSENRITLGASLTAFLVLYLFFTLSKGSRHFLGGMILPRTGVDRSLTEIITTLFSYAIVVVGFFIALSVAGIPLTTFAIVAGGLSVGLGFGLQELVSNFVSGFILMFERSITPGDVIKIDDRLALVDTVGIRSTLVRNTDNMTLIVPNSYLLTNVTTNLSHTNPQVRFRIPVTVGYEAIPREVEAALMEAALNSEYILKDPAPTVQFRDFAENGLEFRLVVWNDTFKGMDKMLSGLRFNIWDALHARGIPFAIPPRILMEKRPSSPTENAAVEVSAADPAPLEN